jgi:hypothetical protein
MPMLFTGRKPDHIARPDFLDRSAVPLNPAATGGNDQSLAERVLCQTVRAPGSNVTLLPLTRAGSGA